MQSLSKRRGLPETELKSLMPDCARNQQSIYVCAYRDAVAADSKLERTVDRRIAEKPACRMNLATMLVAWRKQSIKACAKVAKQDGGGGSMEPAAAAMCQAMETEAFNRKVQAKQGCRLP